MNNVNKTLYIPLYGKAIVSKKGVILSDPKAEQIWAAEGFALNGKSASKWLAYYMGMRAAVFDQWLVQQLQANPETVVLHIGCGMDSRIQRVGYPAGCRWFDIDFPAVIEERRRYYTETEQYHMVGADVCTDGWLAALPETDRAVVVMEGVSMYFIPQQLQALLQQLNGRFKQLNLLLDCYTTFAAKASKYKNPINDVGVTTVYGMDEPEALAHAAGLAFIKEHPMTPTHLIDQLQGLERAVFRKVFAGSFARRMYRLYEYTGG
ncbi:MAG: class I SAM-dependent methyltransferase [Faecalibacterium sp.]|nr:class I SAM-dependent methyltransferase [Faecalibacterium sp.]